MFFNLLRDGHQNFAIGFGGEEVFYLRKVAGVQGLQVTLDSMTYPVCAMRGQIVEGRLKLEHNENFYPTLSDSELDIVQEFLKATGHLTRGTGRHRI